MVCDSKQTLSECDLSFDLQSPLLSLLTMDKIAMNYGQEGVISYLPSPDPPGVYLAAYHIAGMTSEDQKQIIEKYGGKEHMLATWRFYCGISKSILHFESLMELIESDHLYKIQCVYESQEVEFCNKIVDLLSGTFRFKSHVITPGDFVAMKYFVRKY